MAPSAIVSLAQKTAVGGRGQVHQLVQPGHGRPARSNVPVRMQSLILATSRRT